MATATEPQAAAAAPVRGGVTPHPRAGAGRFGPFRLQQLVLLQVAAAALLVAWVIEPMLLIPAGVLALVLVVLAVVRRHQRSLPDWIGSVLALRARRRRAASFTLPAGTEPGLAPLVEADPALRTRTFSDRERRPVGMIGDGTFLTAVVQVDMDATALRPDRSARPLPLAVVRDVLEVDGIRLESAQLVQHTQPAPAPHLPAQSMATRNYAPLQARTGTPAVRLTWIALKLDPELCPDAVAARGGGLAGAQRCVVRAADQLASRLAGAGFRASVLTEQELTAALATSSCANPMAITQAGRSASTGRRTEETARAWRCDDRRHTTYWISRWPQLGGAGAALPQFVALLTSLPALATTFSLTMSPAERHGVTLTGHVRVSGRSDEELVAARRELERTARGVKTGLVRLDREQVPGLLASLPLGGAR
ncbi:MULTISPECIES: type VII secretion protein EccE [unclassified Streptomyces]|uniref:type VII secretion protein EccE n=1 Tax=unclassified Streptomyces TaxID=2593676 RepID=UPI001BE99308|nr:MULTISPECIES: type VII secretion protein EccE [unclassified Streptomyces]MBT2403527.1 type VII secretion protein EccE [Streptomyces sp. ISL-21]MBT2453408.1 type VII secretion protein EccE [Streptomyces sp. ISL-86]MBT2612583.1 type VII secretion protein EccE [Streptomyces sp. ISL-87]